MGDATADCFSPQEVMDFVYTDATHFKACPDGCKRCSNGESCTECGTHLPSTTVYKLNIDGVSDLVCSVGCEAKDRRFLIDNNGAAECKQCPQNQYIVEGTDPPQCSPCQGQGSFVDKSTNLCKKCPEGCQSCKDGTLCDQCVNPDHYSQLGVARCAADCPTGVKKENPKRCEVVTCSNPGDYLQTDQKSCSAGCKDKEYKSQEGSVKVCKPCSTPGCSVCDNNDVCLGCDPGFNLKDKNCIKLEGSSKNDQPDSEGKTRKDVDYLIRQVYDSESKYIFNMELTLEDQTGLDQETSSEIQKSILTNQTGVQPAFKVNLPQKEGKYSLKITKSIDGNKFHLRITLDDTTAVKIGDKLDLIVESSDKVLDPKGTDPSHIYYLTKKTTKIEVEVFKLDNKNLEGARRAVGSITSTANQVTSPTTLGLSLAFTILSDDPDNVFLMMNQFLTLIKRIKLVGIFFGGSLETFIELVGAGNKRKPTEATGQGTEPGRRRLEISLAENERPFIDDQSNASHNKLDLYEQSIFFEGPFMIKTIIYLVSWVFKVVGVILLRNMIKKGEVTKGKIKFLKFQRKIHHMLLMASMMDTYFFCPRILLHRKFKGLGIPVKLVCTIHLTLTTIDILHIIIIGMSLKKVEKSSEEKEIGCQDNNSQRS